MSHISDVIQALPDDIKQIHDRAEEHAVAYGTSAIDPVLYLLAMVELAAGPETPQFQGGRESADLRSLNGSAVSWLRAIGLTAPRIMSVIDNSPEWWSQFHVASMLSSSHMLFQLGERLRPEEIGRTLYKSDLLAAIVLSESVLVMRVFSLVGLPAHQLYNTLRLEPPQVADSSLVTGQD